MKRRQFLSASGMVAAALSTGCIGDNGGRKGTPINTQTYTITENSTDGTTTTPTKTSTAPTETTTTTTTDRPPTEKMVDLVRFHWYIVGFSEYIRYVENDELKQLEPDRSYWMKVNIIVENLKESQEVTLPSYNEFTLIGNGTQISGYDGVPRIDPDQVRLRDGEGFQILLLGWSNMDAGNPSTVDPGSKEILRLLFDIGEWESATLCFDWGGQTVKLWPEGMD